MFQDHQGAILGGFARIDDHHRAGRDVRRHRIVQDPQGKGFQGHASRGHRFTSREEG